MTALEIVMISVTSILAFTILAYFTVKAYFLRFRQNKTRDLTYLNQYVKENHIFFVGDSLTDFYNISDFFVDIPIYNRGIAGDRTCDVRERSQEIINSKPRCIFLQIGINDMINRKISPMKLTLRIVELIQIFNLIPTYVISLYPINRKKMLFSWVFCKKANNKKIVETNGLLKAYCDENNIPFIDVFPHLIDPKGNLKSEYTIEGLHISIKGYEKISMVLKEYVENIE